MAQEKPEMGAENAPAGLPPSPLETGMAVTIPPLASERSSRRLPTRPRRIGRLRPTKARDGVIRSVLPDDLAVTTGGDPQVFAGTVVEPPHALGQVVPAA